MNKSQKLLGLALIAIALAAIGIGALYYLVHLKRMPEGLVAASGRIEGERIIAAAKYPGRLARVMVREGDSVRRGALIAQLDSDQVQARLEQAKQALNATQAQLRAAESSLAVARREIPLNVNLANAGVGQAQATLVKASAVEAQASLDAKRYQDLFERGTIERHRAEQGELAWRVAQADLSLAREALIRAQQGSKQAALGHDKVLSREDELVALRAQRDRAAAALAEAAAVLDDLAIKAPASGVVLSRLREPGEVLMPGSAIAEMVDLDALHLKVYVPESSIGNIRLGLPARLYIDAQPELAYNATVTYIAARAEFTPREVQTTDERVKLMYAVKLSIEKNPQHRLTPGLPADAVIRWKEEVAWQKPSW